MEGLGCDEKETEDVIERTVRKRMDLCNTHPSVVAGTGKETKVTEHKMEGLNDARDKTTFRRSCEGEVKEVEVLTDC